MKLSVQLYTVRDAMGSDPEGTLAKLAATGFHYVELAGTYGFAADEFRHLLDKYNLRVSGAHIGVEALESDLQQVVADAQTLDTEWIIIPYLSEDRRDWPEFAKILNCLGERLRANQLKLAYHNHDFELRDGGLDQLLRLTSSDSVFFQLDLGWIHFAGNSPEETVRKFGHRAPLVHLKDMNPDSANPHVVAGEGTVDWTATIRACNETDVEFGSIEMDLPPNEPVEDVRSCYRYFSSLGLS